MLPASTVLRDLLAGLYGRAYGDRGDVDDLIRLTVKSDLPLDEALAGLEKMTALRPGAYVLDRQQGTVGRVRGLDAEKGGFVVALPEGERVYGAGPVARLEQLEDDDFRALCAFERERVEALARQDPEELVRIVLSALDRRMELRRLRLYLEPVVGSWTKWWSGAREVLKRSASIGMTEGSSPAIFLRSKPLSHAERLLRRFDSLQEPVPKLTMVLEVLREAADGASVPAEALQHLADEASAIAARADEAAVAVLAAAVADAVHEQFADVACPRSATPSGWARCSATPPRWRRRGPAKSFCSAPSISSGGGGRVGGRSSSRHSCPSSAGPSARRLLTASSRQGRRRRWLRRGGRYLPTPTATPAPSRGSGAPALRAWALRPGRKWTRLPWSCNSSHH